MPAPTLPASSPPVSSANFPAGSFNNIVPFKPPSPSYPIAPSNGPTPGGGGSFAGASLAPTGSPAGLIAYPNNPFPLDAPFGNWAKNNPGVGEALNNFNNIVPALPGYAASLGQGLADLGSYLKEKFFPPALPPQDPNTLLPNPPASSNKFSLGGYTWKIDLYEPAGGNRSAGETRYNPPKETGLFATDPTKFLRRQITTTACPNIYNITKIEVIEDEYGNTTTGKFPCALTLQGNSFIIVKQSTNGTQPAGFGSPPPLTEPSPTPPAPTIPDTAPPPLYNPIPDGTPNIVPFKPSPSPTKPDPTPAPEVDPQPSPEQPPDEPQPAPPSPDPEPEPEPDPAPTPSPFPEPAPPENPPVAPNFPAPTPSQPPAPTTPDPEPTPPPIIFPIAPNFPNPQPTPTPAPTPQPQTPVDPLPAQPPAPAQPQTPSPTPKPPTQPSQPPTQPQPLNPETPVAPSPTPLPNPLNPFGLTVPNGNANPDGISEDPYQEGLYGPEDQELGDGMGIGIPPGNVPTSPIPNFGVPPVPGVTPVTPPVPLTPAPVVSTPPQLGIPTTPIIPTVVPQIPPGAKPVFQPGTTPAPIVPVTPDAPLDPCKSSSIDPCTGQISDTLKTNAALTTANAAGIAALAAGLVPVPTPVKIFVKCENNAPVYDVQVVGIPANQVGYVPALFEKIANTEGKSCSESNAIATVPEWWQLRPEANRPQGILVFKEIRPDGTIGKDPYSITIPHCTLTAAPDSSPLLSYKKGSVQGILTLKDNSKLIVNCKDKEECDRVIGKLSGVINGDQLNGSSTKIGDRKGLPFKDIEVKAQRLDFYPNGVKTMKPSYIKSFF